METDCPNCNRSFTNLSMHLHQSKCNFPDLSNEQTEILTGVLMGDGCVNKPGKEPHFICSMCNQDYLQWLDKKFPVYGCGVKLEDTAEESANRARESGFRPTANKSDYSDIYRWQTRTSPKFRQFNNWYSECDGKIFPNTINLTPTILKHWYVCDGHYNTSGNRNRIEIAITNEVDNGKKLINYFEQIGFQPTISGHTLYLSNSQSERAFKYMGNPPKGFEYKWPL